MESPRLLVVAGEASGDLHAARLLGELSALRPGVSSFGLGGDQLIAAGTDILAHSREISVVGLTEALRVIPRARQIFGALLARVDRERPDVAVLVDSPDFNLRLAKELEARSIPVVYYVSPQIWAWRAGRVHQIAAWVEKMLVLFDFEKRFYADHGVDVVHVGHPLVDEIPVLPHVLDQQPEAAAGPFRIALLPGSRRREVERLLPVMLRATARLARSIEIEALLIEAPTVPENLFLDALRNSPIEPRRVRCERFAELAQCHLALCASGTATLELGLVGTPMLVLYRVGMATAALARLLVRVPHISLVNLVLERAAVPELVQLQVRERPVAEAARRLLAAPQRLREIHRELGELRRRLGAPGASRRAAAEVARFLPEVGA